MFSAIFFRFLPFPGNHIHFSLKRELSKQRTDERIRGIRSDYNKHIGFLHFLLGLFHQRGRFPLELNMGSQLAFPTISGDNEQRVISDAYDIILIFPETVLLTKGSFEPRLGDFSANMDDVP